MNKKKLVILNPLILDAAKALYKGGVFKYSSDSAFLRDVLETMANKLKKRVGNELFGKNVYFVRGENEK